MDLASQFRSKESWLIDEDGLWDICLGISLFGLGLTLTLRHPIWFITLFIMAYFLVVMAGKEIITRPRMQYYSIDDRHLIRFSKLLRIGLGIILVAVIAGAISFWVFNVVIPLSWLPDFGIKVLSVSLSGVLLVLGYISRQGSRYYFYSGAFFLAYIIFSLVGLPSITFIYFAAFMLTLSGIVLLIRFLYLFPKSDMEENINI